MIEAHLILLDVFAEGGAHVVGWVGDDINLSTEFLLELKGELILRAERHGVAANESQIDIAIGRLLAASKRTKQICFADVVAGQHVTDGRGYVGKRNHGQNFTG